MSAIEIIVLSIAALDICCMLAAACGVRLIWQSPKLFWWAGLYLKVGHKRYRLLKVGPR